MIDFNTAFWAFLFFVSGIAAIMLAWLAHYRHQPILYGLVLPNLMAAAVALAGFRVYWLSEPNSPIIWPVRGVLVAYASSAAVAAGILLTIDILERRQQGRIKEAERALNGAE